MSNLIAGDVFEKIIEEVVQASQTDFEENGVSQQTLVELRQTWQQKLSARGVAQMPWDPKPVSASNQAQASSAAASNGHNYASPSSQGANPSGARIKPEPTTDASFDNSNYMPPAMNPELAHQRAQNLLQQQYGNQASASLNAMQQQRGIALPGQQQKPPGGLQLPGQSQQSLQQQYAQQLKQQQASQQPRIKTETDGAAEWHDLMESRRAVGTEQQALNDARVRAHISQASHEQQSGLLQPLHGQKRKLQAGPKVVPTKRLRGIPQLDGEFDDDDKSNVKDDDDEDAINSDLDDPEDPAFNAEEEDDDMDSMLCTYDKVQRVKNKWKCVLKDGVLSANGKEYLFHKASGEFEW